jgi:hypothetical protein
MTVSMLATTWSKFFLNALASIAALRERRAVGM